MPYGPPNKCEEAFGILWKLDVPYKIKAFAWRFFLNRISAKYLLLVRGMSFTNNNLKCILCDVHMKDRKHFFFYCWVVKKIWSEKTFWVGKGDRMGR